MRRWLALGVTVVGVAWAPYLYTELAPGKPPESQLLAATQVEPPPAAQLEVLAHAAPLTVEVRGAARPGQEGSPGPGDLPAGVPGAQLDEGTEGLQPLAAAREGVAQPDLGPAPRTEDSVRDDPSRAAQAAVEGASLDSPRGADSAHGALDAPRSTDPTRTESTRPADPTRAEPTHPADPTRAEPTRPADPTRAESTRPADPTRAEPTRPADPTRPTVDPTEPARPPSGHAGLLPRTFDAEPRDAVWASAQEPRVAQLMAAAGLASEDLAEVLCRRSVCRVTFTAPRLADGVEAALAARARADFADLLLEGHDPRSERRAVLYLLRAAPAPEARAPE